MKGTLAALALLLSGELGLQRSESVVTCPIFYEVFGALSLGSRTLLDGSLSMVDATPAEKEALGKVQDCYNEGGLTAKTLDLLAMDSGLHVERQRHESVPTLDADATVGS
ncbi:androgen-binding protein homolog [Ochotona curzoniae]|uniref:androgen-binding protein homolog n=1 Tax=Ochotona curzoniae TaxID=130825 RepID=UPI001B347FB6|nr:androgen-binding protein homolog [Ochotona curzoniae]